MLMSRSWWLGLLCLLLTGTRPVSAEEAHLGGGSRFYGGTRLERPLRLPDGAAKQTLRWRLASNRTTLAHGVVTVKREHPWLEIDLPDVEGRIEARLALLPEQGDGSVSVVELYSPLDLAERLRVGEPVGWVGAPSALSVGGRAIELEAEALDDAAAVKAFPGKILIVPPTTRVDAPLLAALRARAHEGASVVAVGVDDAPWVLPANDPVPSPTSAASGENAFLAGVRPHAFDGWGHEGSAWARPLRVAEGNHRDLVPAYARVYYPGRGMLILAQMRLLEALDVEPLAAEILARLLALARAGPPSLSAPRSVVVTRGTLPSWVPKLFGPTLGDGPAVVVTAGGNPGQAIAKEKPPAVILGAGGSLYLPAEGMETGPGMDALGGERRAELLQFLTMAGLRIQAERLWR